MTLESDPDPAKERALAELEKAKREIEMLQRDLAAGTLDRRRLESGLEKVRQDVCEVRAQVPHFRPKPGP